MWGTNDRLQQGDRRCNATQNRQQAIAEAQGYMQAAARQTDPPSADGYLQKARDRYQAAGQSGHVAYCDRWLVPTDDQVEIPAVAVQAAGGANDEEWSLAGLNF